MSWVYMCFIVLTNNQPLFSMRFDDYYDSEEIPQDQGYLNGIPCFGIKSRCDVSEDCCGPATCVLPSWSPNSVCLVPGYKEDDRLERMSSHNPPRREDVLYIRNTYNTTFYDFLLSDFTPSPSKLEDSLENENLSKIYNIFSFKINDSDVYLSDHEPYQYINNSFLGDNFKSSRFVEPRSEFRSLLEPSSGNRKPKLVWERDSDTKYEQKRSSEFGESVKKLIIQSFQNRHRFLLVNSTIEQSEPKGNTKQIYDKLKDGDQFKLVVKLLQEKLKQVSEREKMARLNFSMTYDNTKHIEVTTLSTPITVKSSKWDLVKTFFFHGSKVNSDLKKSINDSKASTEPKGIVLVERNTQNQTKTNGFVLSPKNKNINREEFNELINKFYKNKQIESVHNNDVHQPTNYRNNDQERIGYLNINIPYNLESTSKGQFSNSKFLKNNTPLKETHKEHQLSGGMKGNGDTLLRRTSSYDSVVNVSTEKTIVDQKKSHLWQKIHFWPIHKNAPNLTNHLKSLFVLSNKSNSFVKPEQMRFSLNENFLLNLNSKKKLEKFPMLLTEIQEREKFHESSLDYSSSLESTSSNAEDLYNNSYVFVVRKGNANDSTSPFRWKKILSFFHITRVIPCPKDKNPCVDPAGGLCTKPESLKKEDKLNLSNIIPVHNHSVILLPENLMPEVLDARQTNDTDSLFLDDYDTEDKPIEERTSSNRTFFLFFKF